MSDDQMDFHDAVEIMRALIRMVQRSQQGRMEMASIISTELCYSTGIDPERLAIEASKVRSLQ